MKKDLLMDILPHYPVTSSSTK